MTQTTDLATAQNKDSSYDCGPVADCSVSRQPTEHK
jgi:hypothetical protein